MNEATTTTLPVRMNSDELAVHLAQNTGTEYWYKHPVNQTLSYTDGGKGICRRSRKTRRLLVD